MKKISVIIPCYNVEPYIDQCVESIINQTYGIENMEIILVDDCSTDGTLEKLQTWEQRYPDNIILIPLDKNIKQGGARNVGLKYASGNYIGFVDSDDWIELDMYEHMVQKMDTYQCDAVVCGVYRNSQDGKMAIFTKSDKDVYYSQEKNVIEGEKNLPSMAGGINSRLYNADFLRSCNVSFPEGLKYEDNYWGSIVALYYHSLYIMKECFYHYRENISSTTLSRNDYSHFDRLTIEMMKIQKYKELGVFEKNKIEYEFAFMNLYYYNTWYLMVARFDEPPYEQFCRMQREILQVFPNYLYNVKLQNETNELYKELVRLIPMTLSKEEFASIFHVYQEHLSEFEKG